MENLVYLTAVNPDCQNQFVTSKLHRWLAFLVMALAGAAQAQVSPLRINEIQADNGSTLQVAGTFPDWIEVYNPSAGTINIGSMTLTDNTNAPGKFVFPANTLVGPHGYLIIYCDGQTNLPFHASFSLGSSGETVALYDSPVNFSAQVDLVPFGLQVTDRTIGRFPDGTGTWQLCQPTPAVPNLLQSLGLPTTLKINEWMATNSAGPNEDWLELYNPDPLPVSLGGLYFSGKSPLGGNDPPIPALSFIAGFGFFKFTCDKNAAKGANHLDFRLSSTSGETLFIYAANRVTVYENVAFPGGQLRDTSEGRLPDGSPNIIRFPTGKSTPGASNFQPLTNVVINEVITHTDPPLEDAIELRNVSDVSVDISYWWLSNSKDDPKKFQIPTGTILPPGGYKVFYEQACPEVQRPCPRPASPTGFNTTGTGNAPDFTLNSAHGDEIFLATADGTGNLTGQRRSITVESAENGVSFGRYITSEGKADIVPLSRRTFGMDNPFTLDQFRSGTGLSNAYPKVGPIVINEIMYHPPDIGILDNSLDEYIELLNISAGTVLFYDPFLYRDNNGTIYADGRTNTWILRGGTDFDFPTGVSLPPGGYLLVVNFDPATNATQTADFRARYNIPPGLPLYGGYKGKLSNSGGTVELRRPDAPQGPQHPDFRFVPYLYVDKINYNDKAPWPLEPDGFGKALQRITPELYGNDPVNWTAAAPTPGRHQAIVISNVQRTGSTVTIEFNGVINTTYSLLYATSLNGGSWQSAKTVVAQPTSGLRTVSDSSTNSPARFYRIVTPAVP